MAIAFDAFSEFERTLTTDPQTWTHTPVGTPRGVSVHIVHGVTATSHVVSVSYGGVALALVNTAADTATEPGVAEEWFLGSGIPTGAQTVSVDLDSATADDIHFVAITYTADTDTEVVDIDEINNNIVNPSRNLLFFGRTCLAVAALYGGGASPASFAENANCTRVADFDMGAFYSVVFRQTTPGSADFDIGGTAAIDDVAFVCMAISELAVVSTVPPRNLHHLSAVESYPTSGPMRY